MFKRDEKGNVVKMTLAEQLGHRRVTKKPETSQVQPTVKKPKCCGRR